MIILMFYWKRKIKRSGTIWRGGCSGHVHLLVRHIGGVEMKLQYIKDKVSEIKDIAHDDEAAHSEEDILYKNFIEHVAKTGNKKLAEMANECLKTKDIYFSKRCA